MAFAAAFTVLNSKAWIPVYARSIMPDALIDGDKITTPPLVEVRNGHIWFADRESDSDGAKSGDIVP